jgi:anti-anti-sigma factor
MDGGVQVRDGRVHIHGEMTVYAAAALAPAVFAALAEHRPCEVDLSAVTELDTSGLQILLTALRHSARQGRALTLVRPSSAVREVLALIGLDALAAGSAAS